jgi:superfamily II DNA or RNA helicase
VRLYNKESLEHDENVIMVSSYGTTSTGISINNIHNLYLVESFKSDVIIRQSIGRGLRKHALKDKLIIYDFVDDLRTTGFKNYLYKHAEARRVIYDEQSFPYTIRKVNLNKVYKTKDI